MAFSYSSCALGGTFDHFHVGHEQLLQTAFTVASKVTIGVTTAPLLVSKKYSKTLESFDTRTRSLTAYIHTHGWEKRAHIVPLQDVAGPTVEPEADFDVLVVSTQTVDGATYINSLRASLGMSQLPVVQAEMVADGHGAYISSTRIRSGEIDRDGNFFLDIFSDDFRFTEAVLEMLAQPQGRILKDTELAGAVSDTQCLVAVGDRVVERLVAMGVSFDHAVIDHRSRRRAYIPDLGTYVPNVIYRAANEAGSISDEAALCIAASLKDKDTLLCIEGEEDLLALCYVMLAPLGSRVLYGQPEDGIVMMEVTTGLKSRMRGYLEMSNS